MEIVKTLLSIEKTTYDLSAMDDLEHLLFFDIETTGFSAKTSQLVYRALFRGLLEGSRLRDGDRGSAPHLQRNPLSLL